MSFLKNKYVLIGLAAVAGYFAYRWWKKRQGAAPATTGAASKAAAGA